MISVEVNMDHIICYCPRDPRKAERNSCRIRASAAMAWSSQGATQVAGQLLAAAASSSFDLCYGLLLSWTALFGYHLVADVLLEL
jgi:hypothetical protein